MTKDLQNSRNPEEIIQDDINTRTVDNDIRPRTLEQLLCDPRKEDLDLFTIFLLLKHTIYALIPRLCQVHYSGRGKMMLNCIWDTLVMQGGRGFKIRQEKSLELKITETLITAILSLGETNHQRNTLIPMSNCTTKLVSIFNIQKSHPIRREQEPGITCYLKGCK